MTKILTGRIEEVQCNSKLAEHYMTIRGRDLGEDLFRKHVIKTYENMEGSLVVKNVIENYTSLGHIRDSTELIETNEEFHSDDTCYQRARSLLVYLKDPAEYLTIETSLLTGDNLKVFPGEKTSIAIPNDNIDAAYRVVSIDHRIRGVELETTLELGWEPPLYPTLFSDYAERMKSLERGTGRGKIGFT